MAATRLTPTQRPSTPHSRLRPLRRCGPPTTAWSSTRSAVEDRELVAELSGACAALVEAARPLDLHEV